MCVLVFAGCVEQGVDEDLQPVSNQRQALISGFTGPLTTNDWPVLALQGDGTVIFSSWVNTASWSPVTNQWTTKAAPPQPLSANSASALTNGKVMRATGGAPGSNVAQLYDPATNTWLLSTLNESHTSAGAAPLPNGSALVAGGQNGTMAERYNVTTNTWTPVGAVNATSSDGLRLLRDGRVFNPSSNFMNVYDPVWNLTQYLSPGTLATSAAVELEDGKVLAVGPTAWYLLDVDALTWLAVGPLSVSRGNFALVRLTDGRVLRVGRCPGP